MKGISLFQLPVVLITEWNILCCTVFRLDFRLYQFEKKRKWIYPVFYHFINQCWRICRCRPETLVNWEPTSLVSWRNLRWRCRKGAERSFYCKIEIIWISQLRIITIAITISIIQKTADKYLLFFGYKSTLSYIFTHNRDSYLKKRVIPSPIPITNPNAKSTRKITIATFRFFIYTSI